jgi:colanic acid/amylovoran biosynthesis glycosyltransferase
MSPDMKKDLMAVGCPEEKIILHYYGTDTRRFHMQRTYGHNEKARFLIVCGLSPQKGHMFLLEAFKLACRQAGDRMTLHIVGDGILREEIREYVEVHQMKNVVLEGPVPYGSKEHIKHMKEADVFIHPSVTAPDGAKEGIPGAIIEAMASGLPVISTEHAGIPYVIEHGKTGLLVREGDTEGVCRHILRLAGDKDLRESLGVAAQRHALEVLDLGPKEKELEEIYRSLIR